MCGEQALTLRRVRWKGGSSPRVRGTVYEDSGLCRGQRFIPACAGNRSCMRLPTLQPSVHPRVCGEQPVAVISRIPSHGSSPRVRGTVTSEREIHERMRFIPACAGNSRLTKSVRAISTVHPRVCGEQLPALINSSFVVGSSPRVRGTGRAAGPSVGAVRFIPACAGNRTSAARTVSPLTVHPRVCGEQYQGFPAISLICGSSPRVRGTAVFDVGHFVDQRFIPACAGNSIL